MSEDGLAVQSGSAVFTPALHHYYPFAITKGEGTAVLSKGGRRYLDIFAAALAEIS